MVSLQKTWIKPLDSYGFILISFYDPKNGGGISVEGLTFFRFH